MTNVNQITAHFQTNVTKLLNIKRSKLETVLAMMEGVEIVSRIELLKVILKKK
jgi:hypothetical protein